ncbi:MAG: biotin transporter BioY [Phyllobacterium sp.]
MTDTGTSAFAPSFNPLRLSTRSTAFKFAAVVLGTLLLAASSWIEVPMYPVPVTMQTFAVTLIGALYGWRLGGLTVLAWLGEAAIGMPVLAGGAGGLAHFAGPTAGYLVAFPFVAALVGWLAERGWSGHNVVRSFTAMLMGNALCLAFGAFWLSAVIGPEKAIALGVTPFIIGAVLKSALGAATLKLLARNSGGTAQA